MRPGNTIWVKRDDRIYFGLVIDVEDDNLIVSVSSLDMVFITDKKGNYISTYKVK